MADQTVISDDVQASVPSNGEVAVTEKKNKTAVDLKGNTKGAAVGTSATKTSVTSERNLTSTELRQSTSSNNKNKPNEVNVKAPKINDTDVVNDAKQGLEFSANTAAINELGFTSTTRKVDDKFKYEGAKKNNASSKTNKKGSIKNSDLKLGKGDDTVTFGKGVKFKGETKIALGKGGTDKVVIGSKVKGGKVTVTQFTKKDTIKVAGETFTHKDIKDGAQIPGIDVKLA